MFRLAFGMRVLIFVQERFFLEKDLNLASASWVNPMNQHIFWKETKNLSAQEVIDKVLAN